MLNKVSIPHSRPTLTIGMTAAIAAVIFSAIAFIPLLGFKGRIATFMFDADAFDFWIPQFNVLQVYVQQGVFQGLDYFTHNGSAEWFLRPNLTAYFPPYLLVSILFPVHDVIVQAWIIIFIEFICSIASMFFVVMLANRVFGLRKLLSVFMAVGYTFSWHYLIQINYVPFSFIAWLMPSVIYYSLMCARSPNWGAISCGAFATFCLLTAGYVPLALQALALSGVMVGFVLLNSDSLQFRALVRAAIGAAAPVLIAIFVTSPWLIAMAVYSEQTIDISLKNNIDYSAYQLAELPQSFLRVISGSLKIPGPFYEFSAHLGPLLITIFVLFLMIPRETIQSILSKAQFRTLWFSLAVFLCSWMIIYGSHSTLASMFFFFTPVAGFSHIYQRYLPLAHLFVLLSSAHMLHVILAVEQPRLEKQLLGLSIALTVVLAVVAGLNLHDGSSFGFTQELILEVFYVSIFLTTLVAMRGQIAILVAIAALLLPALDRGYEFSTLPGLSFEAQQRKYMPLTASAVDSFDEQLSSFVAQKQVLKIVDLTPGVHGYLPVNYPWFRAHKLNFSTYSGYDWHVGVPSEYRALNPMIVAPDGELRFNPSPIWVAATGADVIIYDPNDPYLPKNLLDLVDQTRPGVSVPHPGGNYVLAPLIQSHAPVDPAADNGYFRLAAEGVIKKFVTNQAGNFDFDVQASTAGALQYQFWPSKTLKVWVNGVQATTFINAEGILSIPVEAGTSVVKVRYENRLLNVFLIFYGVFAAGLVLTALWAIARAVVAWRRGRATGIKSA